MRGKNIPHFQISLSQLQMNVHVLLHELTEQEMLRCVDSQLLNDISEQPISSIYRGHAWTD
jgi:hypothetical protein